MELLHSNQVKVASPCHIRSWRSLFPRFKGIPPKTPKSPSPLRNSRLTTSQGRRGWSPSIVPKVLEVPPSDILEAPTHSSRPELRHLYSPPSSDIRGILTAGAVVAAWVATFYAAHFQTHLTGGNASHPLQILGLWMSLEFLNTGLFITAHDAMHGVISYKDKRLNDLIGSTALTLFAMFDYKMLRRKHHEHHRHTGLVGKDPDFHRGDIGVLPWFIRFMMEYLTLDQLAKLMGATLVLRVMGAPMENMLLYYLGAGLASSFRLFYFGTYLPHQPTSATELMSWEKSKSASCPPWMSFLKCYHFDYHWEHHRWPSAPWWDLPRCKQLLDKAGK